MAIKYVSKTFFTYEVDYDANLAPLAVVNLTFNINGDSDFFWQKFAMFALVGGVATTRDLDQLPAISMAVTNTTTGRQYQVQGGGDPPAPNLSAYRQFLPLMTVWPRKSTILIHLHNFDAGPGMTTYSRLQLSFMGTKAFPSS
jgi:hypothetical protein